MAALVTTGRICEDSGATCMARARDNTGEYVTQAGLSSISRKVFDLSGSTPTVAVQSDAVTIATSVFDTLQTGGRWTEDETGYNFSDTVPASLLSSPDHWYRIEYKFTPLDGEVFWAIFEVHTDPVYSS